MLIEESIDENAVLNISNELGIFFFIYNIAIST